MAEMRNVLPLFSTQVRDAEHPTADGASTDQRGSVATADPKSAAPESLRSEAFGWSPVAGARWSLPASVAPSKATRSRHSDLRRSSSGEIAEAKSSAGVDMDEARKKIEEVTQRLSQRGGGRSPESQLQASLSQASMRMMTGQFTLEVRRVLKEQEMILPLLPASREWALKVLNRQYYALRTAAELLRQDNLATVAGRAEVLVSLLSRNKLPYREAHHEVLKDTWELLSSIAARIASDGSDKLCFTTAKTAICLYATAEPITEGYAPAVAPKQKTQSPR